MTTNPEAEIRLAPCPFCGGEARIFKTWVPRSRERIACCADQGCLGHQMEQDEQGGWAASAQTDAEAITAWNTRAAAPVAPAVPEMLVDADWLRRRIESDPDGDCEAGVAPAGSDGPPLQMLYELRHPVRP